MGLRNFQLESNHVAAGACSESANIAKMNAAMNDRTFRQPLISRSNGDRLILPRAMLFDMDGTLTAPFLDFDLIKAEMGIGDQPILEALGKLDNPNRQAAESVLHRHEQRCAAECKLNP